MTGCAPCWRRGSPGVRAVAGRGEAIPVPDACADAVFVSSAWHWLDPGLAVPEKAPLGNIADASFGFVRTMSLDDAVDWMATYSGVITAAAAERAAELARAREALRRQADGDGMIEMPMRSACWRANRMHRGLEAAFTSS